MSTPSPGASSLSATTATSWRAIIDVMLPAATAVCMLAAIYAVFLYAPPDKVTPGQPIFYVHLAMWLPTYVAFVVVGVSGLLYLWQRTNVWDRLGQFSAEVGLLFCSLGLATGSIWARPAWGTWWTWDPRLTLSLILWIIYATYLLLRIMSTDREQGSRLAAILGIAGVANLYLVYKAIYWWGAIHPAVLRTREGGSGLSDPRMRFTLMICVVAFFLLFLWILRLRMQTAELEEGTEELREQLTERRESSWTNS
jgi:heme exporter protein C